MKLFRKDKREHEHQKFRWKRSRAKLNTRNLYRALVNECKGFFPRTI